MLGLDVNIIPNKENVALLLDDLEPEDYQAAISYIGYLAALRKNKRKNEPDNFYSEENTRYLKAAAARMEAGQYEYHGLIED